MQAGVRYIGRYRLLRSIGSGGMGEVYLAEDTLIPRQVAIKVIRTELSSYPNASTAQEVARLFQREARVIATLDHPHILPLLDYGEETTNGSKSTYMVMPFRQEGTLTSWLNQRPAGKLLPPADVADIVNQAADALQYAHNHNIIHQDVKPSNFLIRYRSDNPNLPDLLLADFGVAKITSGTGGQSQSVRGTATYMAPEQWRGSALPASDQYALAIMAYELLTGRPPFVGRMESVMYAHLTEQPKPPSMLNAFVPSGVNAVILRALAKNPQDRFPSVLAFAQALREAVQNSGNLYATLPISRAEAQFGTNRMIPLPAGRKVMISIPPGAYEGQFITLEGMGDRVRPDSPPGSLSLVITITPPEDKPATDSSIVPNITADKLHATSPLPFLTGKSLFMVGIILFLIFGSGGLLYFSGHLPFTDTAITQATTSPSHPHKTATPNVSVNETATALAGATATASVVAANPDLYPPGGTLVLYDPLHDNSLGYNWDDSEGSNGSCHFINGAYVLKTAVANYSFYCTAEATSFSNFAYEVQMKIVQGNAGGLAFRVANANNAELYYFRISRDGTYALTVFQNHSGYFASTGSSSVIKTGLNQTNTLAVVANGHTINLYINHTLVKTLTNTTYTQGQIGLVANDINNPTEVIFSNARVWKL